MKCHGSQGRLRGKLGRAAASLVEENGAGLRELLPAEIVHKAVQSEGVRCRDCLFTPLVTVWLFLMQELSPDGTCRAAVARLLALLAAKRGGTAPDANCADPETGPYCKARKRLPERLVSRLAKDAGKQLHDRYPAGRSLGGRKVKVADGTTCSMPDTPENQKDWPQPPTQKPGLGFPLVRLVAVLSMNCAAVLDVATGPYKGKQTGETALLRTIMESLEKGDVLLADRYYASYCMIALLLARGVDSLFRQHQTRKIDFRSGRRLGPEDHVIMMKRPAQRPDWMDKAEYEQMPAELVVREVRLRVCQRGFRVRMLVLVTTLLEHLENFLSVERSASLRSCPILTEMGQFREFDAVPRRDAVDGISSYLVYLNRLILKLRGQRGGRKLKKRRRSTYGSNFSILFWISTYTRKCNPFGYIV